MMLGKVFEQFVRHSPVCVMLRGVLEYALPKERVDELFRKHAETQYEDQLLFSTVVNVLALAVCQVRRSVNAAYGASREKIKVSVTALYDKLQGTETSVSQALVRESAQRLLPVIDQMDAALPSPLPGYYVKLLDGKHLGGTEHRLAETRSLNSQPLPGHCLVVLDPQRMLAVDVFPCEDAYAQERSLLGQVLPTIRPGEVWIADRNFCTTKFLFGIVGQGAGFLIRQHGSTLSGKKPVGRRRRIGKTADGSVIYEQGLQIVHAETGEELTLRRITIKLVGTTRDGDREIHLLTNLPDDVDALAIAELYRGRWTIETAFQELGQALDAEIDTLCYPKAALLAFCVALYTYNAISTLKAALRAAHGQTAALQRISGYYLAEELSAVYGGMMIAIEPRCWIQTFRNLDAATMAQLLTELATHVHLRRFLKRTRSPKKPPPKRTGGLREKHVSTARLLAARIQ